MKQLSKISLFVLTLFLTQNVFAQNEPKIPEPPEVVDVPSLEFEFQKMNETEEKELLKNFKKELQNELKLIKEMNKSKYFNFLRESQFKNMKIPFIVKREKENFEREKRIFEAEVKTEALAAKYTKANKDKKESIKRELRAELSNLFEQKEVRRKEEVAELEKELIELKKSLAIRQKNKQEIIDRRIQELLEEDEYLDWD